MVDYILNVAVGISAGIGALTSSVPALQPWTLTLCLGVLAVVTLANLRGTSEAGLLFALPTYVFIVSFIGLVGTGLWQIVLTGGHPHPVIAPPPLSEATGTIGVWLFMRAFAAGCTAMTGVEAVSNGVGSFKEPVIRQAHITLTIICLVLGLLLAGIAAVAHAYGLGAMDQTKPDYQSVLSQLTAAIAGRGVVYYVAMASLLAVLCLSANTSFVGFPALVPYRGVRWLSTPLVRGCGSSAGVLGRRRRACRDRRWPADPLRRNYRQTYSALRHRGLPNVLAQPDRHGVSLAKARPR